MTTPAPHSYQEPNDAALIDGFESQSLPLESWVHRSHVRVAVLYLSRFGFDGALERLRTRIQAFNQAKGVKDTKSSGYHETLTVAWLRVIANALDVMSRPPANSLEFCRQHEHLLDKTLLRRHYSSDRMLTEEAKRQFVEPDLEPLPGVFRSGAGIPSLKKPAEKG
jgi:hypothetical protein